MSCEEAEQQGLADGSKRMRDLDQQQLEEPGARRLEEQRARRLRTCAWRGLEARDLKLMMR